MSEASVATIDTDVDETDSTVPAAVADIAAGRPVIVVDDVDRENEGDLVLAAEHATPELLAFMIRHTSGVICVPMEPAALDRLRIPLMIERNTERMGTAYTVSVDARDGVTTGISAADRARTIRLLADPATTADDLARPGHVFPLRYVDGGVLRRGGHTEASVDLARLAGLTPAGVIAEIVNDDGTLKRRPELVAFAAEHGLTIVSIAALAAYRRRSGRAAGTAIGPAGGTLERAAEARLPTRHGQFRAIGYRCRPDRREHLALIAGDLGDGLDVLVRVHSECLTGDVFGSLRCDCGPQLDLALARVAAEGRGLVVYVRGHEGRGVGLLPKLAAYRLQDAGADTVDANLSLGLPADARDYSTGAQILADLGVRTMRLLTNNPAKRVGLERPGLRVIGTERLPVAANPENLRYLRTKRDRMGHDLPGLPDLERAGPERVREPAGRAGAERAGIAATPPGSTDPPVLPVGTGTGA